MDENPVLKLYEYIIFRYFNEVTIKRPEKYGGDVTYDTYKDLEKDYSEGKIHPLDLKENAARYLNEILDPVREYFKENPDNYMKVRKIVLGH